MTQIQQIFLLLLLLLLPIFQLALKAEPNKVDSLKNVLEELGDDTTKVNLYFKLAELLYGADNKQASEYCQQALELSEKINYKYGIAEASGWLSYFFQFEGNKEKALEMELQALKIREELNDLKSISTSLNNIGFMYENMGEVKKSREHYKKCLEIRKQLNDAKGIANVLNNLGYSYDMTGEKEKALLYYQQSLAALEELNDVRGIARQLNNIAAIQLDNGEEEKALKNVERALELNMGINNKEGLLSNYSILVKTLVKLNQTDKALDYAKKSLALANDASRSKRKDALYLMVYAYSGKKEYKKALEYYYQFSQAKDSITKSENTKYFAEMEAQYQNEKKQLEIDNLNKDNILKELEINNKEKEVARQRTVMMAGGVILLFVVFFALYVFRSLKQKKRANAIISRQKEEVEKQKDMVEEKNKEITDSITYARRLQEAILPPKALVKEWLHDSFILYKPKDIVAGDFYWLEAIGDTVYFAAADCTGHGVPGAMVSVVCSHALSKSLIEENITEPAKILDRTRELVIERFEKSEEEVNDGMDISLCSLNIATKQIQWTGANNPLWIINPKRKEWPDGAAPFRNVEGGAEIRPDKQPIGKYAGESPFTNHIIQLQEGDTIYLFSDGYPDQFGGEKGKKFKAANFKELLLNINAEPMQKQRELINETFENWRGDLEQVDDVCVIGVRV